LRWNRKDIISVSVGFCCWAIRLGLGTSADLQLWQQKANPSYLDRNLGFSHKFWTGQIREFVDNLMFTSAWLLAGFTYSVAIF